MKIDSSDLDADSTIILSDVFKKFAADYNSPVSPSAPIVPKVEPTASQSPSTQLPLQEYTKEPAEPQKPATAVTVSKNASTEADIPQVLPTEQIAPQELSAQADVTTAFPTSAVTLPTLSAQSSMSPSKHIVHSLEDTTYYETTVTEHSDNENDMTSLIMTTSGIPGQELGQNDIAGSVLLPAGCISIGSNTEEMQTKKRVRHTTTGKKRGPYRSKLSRGIPVPKDEILDESGKLFLMSINYTLSDRPAQKTIVYNLFFR